MPNNLLDTIKTIGCILSILLFIIAMQARISPKINTKQLGADWALLLVGACGLCFLVFFWELRPDCITAKSWWALILGIWCHVLGLALWYGQNIINTRRNQSR